jgi:hypothetical protein
MYVHTHVQTWAAFYNHTSFTHTLSFSVTFNIAVYLSFILDIESLGDGISELATQFKTDLIL